MSLAFRSAIAASIALAGIALGDAVTHGLTGKYSALSDDYGTTGLWLAGNVAHGLTYAALAWVLVSEGRRVDAGSRGRRIIRRGLLGSFGVLAVYFLVAAPYFYATEADLDSVPPVFAALLVAFPLTFVFALTLGVLTRRMEELRPASLTLLAILPVIGLTALLAVVAPDFSHPAYLETVTNFGVALLGYHAVDRSRDVPLENVRVSLPATMEMLATPSGRTVSRRCRARREGPGSPAVRWAARRSSPAAHVGGEVLSTVPDQLPRVGGRVVDVDRPRLHLGEVLAPE